MGFELMYLSRAGNRSYWTKGHHFSKNDHDHYVWDSQLALVADFDRLCQDYPTIFKPKKDERFYAGEQGTDNIKQLVSIAVPTEGHLPNGGQADQSPLWVSNKIDKKMKKDKKYYVVAVMQDDNYHFLDTTLYENGGFVYPLNTDVRRWKEAEKAVATAEMLTDNQRFWLKNPAFNGQFLSVLDLRNGQAIWSSDERQPDSSFLRASKLTDQLDQLSQRLASHFNQQNRGSLMVTERTKEQPAFDLTTYNAVDFFNSLKYLLQCLIHREELNRLLGWYDGKILQDQLHVVELSDLSTINVDKFVQYLQKTRRIRREVKDLAILMNTVAANMDVENTIRKLNGNLSLANHYQYRDRQSAEVLQQLMVGDGQKVEDE